MLQTLANPPKFSKIQEAILQTLSFFHIYKLPLTSDRIWELLYKTKATPEEVEKNLTQLVRLGVLDHHHDLYGLEDWDQEAYDDNQLEIRRRWNKIKKYYGLLS